jgi:hypothetical protein
LVPIYLVLSIIIQTAAFGFVPSAFSFLAQK